MSQAAKVGRGRDVGSFGARVRAARRWVRNRVSIRPELLSVMLVIGLVAGLTTVLASPLYSRPDEIRAGQPSPRDVDAPRSITFESEVLTSREQQRAAEAVQPVYRRVEENVAARQRERARAVLNHIALVRANPHADTVDKVQELAAVPELSELGTDQLERLLALDSETWGRVAAEVPIVVGQTMRQPIRPDALGLVRGGIIDNVAREMDNTTASLVAQVAGRFIVPNATVDEPGTERARASAREAVAPRTVSIAAGQTIVRAGDIVQPEQIEAMEQLGLLRRTFGWRDVLGLGVLMAVAVTVVFASLDRVEPTLWRRPRSVALIAALVLAFTVGARFAVPEQTVLGYTYPAAAVAMTITVLLGLEAGLLSSVLLAIALGMLAVGGRLEMATYVVLGSMVGSLVLGRVERLTSFLTAGAALVLVNLAVILSFRLPSPATDLRGVAELAGAAVAHGLLSTGLTALAVMTAGALFGVTTSLQLLELARPDHPLLRDLQTRAPGTYQHSIVLANLAERAASAIGADALLVRVGAYYHDIGKSLRPYFFVENQLTGTNPHSGLDAYASTRIILSHVTDGAALAEEHGLPEAVVDFIWQHHGTTRVAYFCHKAIDLLGAEAVDPADFEYPGPRPQSRETAIVMLADGAEAAVRANNPQTAEEMIDIVERIFQQRLTEGQLDDSDLTLRDLGHIRQTFIETLRSMYHPRVKYPEDIAVPSRPAAQAVKPH